MAIDKDVIRNYALENAVKHSGKAQQGAVLSGLFAEGLKKEDVKKTIPLIKEILKEINSLSLEEQIKEHSKIKDKIHKRDVRAEGELPELENAENEKVVMRLAPFPSGPLHIGNTRALILNKEYVKKYNGKFILFMDDTIGSEEKQIEPDAYELIKQGVKWIGADYDEIYYKSDRNEKYYAYAEEMIKKGYMYACDCSQEKFHELRTKGIDCPCRHLPFETHLQKWKEMFLPSTKPGKLVIRLKTDMQDPDPAFRDRVMFKISERTHPRTKNKYKVYPSMEFSWAIDDHLIGTTHVLRGIEHQMSTRVQDFIRNIFSWENPISIYNGHLELEGVKISKSKGSKEVHSGNYIGWNDPRTWSLQSLRDRGIQPEAIKDFILNMGVTKSNSVVPVDVLYALNKKYLEESPRYFFVPNPVKIKIKASPEIEKELPLHPNLELNEKMKKKFSQRKLKTTQEFLISSQDFELMRNANYRLMHLFTFQSQRISNLQPIEFRFVSESPSNDVSLKFLQWLPADGKNVKIKIRMPNNEILSGLGEPALKNLIEKEIVQFERFGFAKLYKKSKTELEFWFSHR